MPRHARNINPEDEWDEVERLQLTVEDITVGSTLSASCTSCICSFFILTFIGMHFAIPYELLDKKKIELTIYYAYNCI